MDRPIVCQVDWDEGAQGRLGQEAVRAEINASLRPVALKIARGIAILLDMFSEAVLDHFRNPRNAGELDDATATVEVSNPVCGDILKLAARVVEGRFAVVRFLCRGCTTSIACASMLTEKLHGRTISEVREITAESLSEALGSLPLATFHGAQLAADALASLLRKVAMSGR